MATVTADELARLLGVSSRTLRDLAERGVVQRSGRGQYDLEASIPRYCESLREAASGRGGDATVQALAAERSRLAREQADAVALRNAAARRELVPAAEVESAWKAVLLGLRAGFLALPARLQQRLGHLSAHDVSVVDEEIRDVLREMSE